MADLDFSNPLMVIVGFFGLMFTVFILLIKVLTIGFVNPMAGILVGLVSSVVFFQTMSEK